MAIRSADWWSKSRIEGLVRQGFSKKVAMDIVAREEQARQVKELKRAEKRAFGTTEKLRKEFGIRQPVEPPVPGRTWGLLDVFDLFYILEYPVFNAIKHMADGSDAGEVLKSVFRGLALQEKTTGDELLESLGMDDGKGRSIAGFMLELAANPLNYVGGPLGMTKLGKLARAGQAGRLKGVKETSRMGKRIMKMFPKAKNIEHAINKLVPEVAPTWGKQAATGQRALVTFLGKKVVAGEPVVNTLGKFGRAVLETKFGRGFKTLFGVVSDHTYRRAIMVFRKNFAFQDDAACRAGGQIRHLIEQLPGDAQTGMRGAIVKLLGDAQFSTALAITDGSKRATVESFRMLRTIRKASQKYIKAGALDDEVAEGLLKTVTLGHSNQDANFIVSLVHEALGPTMTKKLGGKSKFMKHLFREAKESVTFNPNWLQEYFRVINPGDAFSSELGKSIAEATRYGLTESVEDFVKRFGPLWANDVHKTTKGLFNRLAKNAWTRKEFTGPLGAFVEATGGNVSAHSDDLFAHGLHFFLKDPATILAQSPEMFYIYQSLTRFGMKGADIPNMFKMGKGLITRATAIRKAQSGMSAIDDMFRILPRGMSADGKIVTRLLHQHLTTLTDGKTRKGAFSQLSAIAKGTLEELPASMQKNMKINTVLGQTVKDLERLGTIIADPDLLLKPGGKDVILRLQSRGLINDTLLSAMNKLSAGDRLLVSGRLVHGFGRINSVLGGVLDDSVNVAAKSYLGAKAFENVIGAYMLEHMSIGEKGARFVPGGDSILDITNMIRAGKGAHVPENVYRTAQFLKGEFDKFKKLETYVGALTSSIKFYVPRILTKEYKKAEAAGRITLISSSGTMKGTRGFAKGRIQKLRNLTLDDINTALLKKDGVKMFVDDPELIYAMRASKHANAIGYEDLIEKCSKIGENVKRGTTLVGDEANKFGILEGSMRSTGKAFTVKVPRDVKQYVDGYQTLVTSQVELQELGTLWSEMVTWFKSWTLGIFPAYHVRNMASNMTQCWIAGLRNPWFYHKARQMQMMGDDLADDFMITDGGVEKSMKEIHEAGLKLGIPGTGLFSAELPDMVRKSVDYYGKYGRAPKTTGELVKATLAATGAVSDEGVKGALKKAGQWMPLVGRRQNKLLSLGFLAGRGIENNARWALFLHEVQKGKTYEEAAETVAKFLFDYSDISIGVSKLRNLFPFITWTRKNFPMQVENFLLNPASVAPMVMGVRAGKNLTGLNEIDMPDLPQFIRESVPVPLKKDEYGDYKMFLFGNWLAVTDVERLFDPVDEIINMLFPGVKVPVELLTNHSFYRHTSIERGYPGEKRKFMGIDMDPQWAHVLKSFRILNDTHRMFGLGDEIKDDTMSRVLRFLTGYRTHVVDPEQEMLKRYRKHSEGLGALLSYERYKQLREGKK